MRQLTAASTLSMLVYRATKVAYGCSIFLAALVLGLQALPARAEPITYTGVTVTDGKLGSWSFHNARVYLTMISDTTQAQLLSPYPNTDVVVALNTYGDAYITI